MPRTHTSIKIERASGGVAIFRMHVANEFKTHGSNELNQDKRECDMPSLGRQLWKQ